MSPQSSFFLVAGDPDPVIVTNPHGASPFLLLGDHAGRAVPAALNGLGVAAADMDKHIAWDIGVAGLGERLAPQLDATFIRQAYSRLVIDCNRAPGAQDSIPASSDGVAIPANEGLLSADTASRAEAIFQPYQDRIAAEIEAHLARGQRTVLVSLHSFTPAMAGFARPWRFGVLHRGDSAFSKAVLAALREDFGDEVGDNQPYSMDIIDYTIPLHADRNGLDYLELEVRQDLLADEAGQAEIAAIVGPLLIRALAAIR